MTNKTNHSTLNSLPTGILRTTALLIALCSFFICNCAGTVSTRGADGASTGEPEVAVFPQMGHSALVTSVAFSPDRKFILSSSGDNTIKLWDMATGREIRTFSGHTAAVNSVAFSPNGKQILSGSLDKTIKLWDTATGREIRTFIGHGAGVRADWEGGINSVAFSPNGRQILSGSSDKTIKLWDTATGREIRTFSPDGLVRSVTFSLDGKQALSGSTALTTLWDIGTGRVIRTFRTSAYSVIFSPDGKQALSSDGSTSQIKLWDIATGSEIRSISFGSGRVNSVAFSPDGSQFAASATGGASYAGSVKLWDTATGREIHTFSGYTSGAFSVTFSPDGRQVLSGSGDGTIKLWDAATGREVKAFSGLTYDILSTSFSPDGKQAVSGFLLDGGLRQEGIPLKIWDMEAGSEINTLQGHTASVFSVSFSPDGKQILSGSFDETMKLWDAATGREIRTFSGHEEPVNFVTFSPDGRQARSLSGGLMFGVTLKLWDITTGRETRTFSGDTHTDNFVAFSPDGRHALSDAYPDAMKLWDLTTGREIRTFSGEVLSNNSVTFSPDGKQALSNSRKNLITLWDIETGREVRTFSGHSGEVISLTFSPDGKQAISGSLDFNIKLWDLAAGNEVRTFSGHTGEVYSIAFSQDGQRVFSSSRDGTVRIWDKATGNELAQLISFTDDEWIAITPEGYYKSSPNGDQHLNVRVGNNVFGIDQYRTTFYNPGIVELALSGDRNAYLAAIQQGGITIQGAASPPQISITGPSASVSAARTNISVTVDGGSQSIEYLTVLVNGRIVARDMGVTPPGTKGITPVARLAALSDGNVNRRQARFSLDIPLDPGSNTVEVLAFNGYSEGRALTEIVFQTTQTATASNLPNMYILSIGVNSYTDNSIPNLRFAANDAQRIVDAFRVQEGRRFGSVKSLVIADGTSTPPTRSNIADGLDFLRGAGANDVMVLFLSGHGGSDDRGNFFFMPGNTAFNQNGAVLRSSIIPNSELQDVLRFPGQKLVFIDSCYSGGITGMQSGGVNNDRLINSLKDDAPVIFTSSTGTQLSWEHEPARLGLFTHVLIQGLSGAADLNKDGRITIEELGAYVRQNVPGIRSTQQPYFWSPPGYRNFVVAEVR